MVNLPFTILKEDINTAAISEDDVNKAGQSIKNVEELPWRHFEFFFAKAVPNRWINKAGRPQVWKLTLTQ